MTDLSKAKIFLSDERGRDERDASRSIQTFNFGKYFNEYKSPFGNLYVCNDDTLAGAHSTTMIANENSFVLLLPVVGAIICKDNLGNEHLINVGELQSIHLPKNAHFEISNPYEKDPVNFLQFWIKSGTSEIVLQPSLRPFNLDEDKNKLLELNTYPACSIGQFTGRQEAIYEIHNKNTGLFIFVIEGAFEVHGRLLHPRDALALWDLDEPVELEALSNDAIIFMVEVS